MELVDGPLATLAGPNPGMANQQLMAAGHTEDAVRGTWNLRTISGLHGIDRVGRRPTDRGREG